MKKRLTYFLLALIILLAFFLRFYKLTKVPPSLNWDEVSFGYNAFSILKTGRDEFGTKLPVFNFRSLDDFKMPAQLYLIVASEKVFGISDFAVRFPSALLGSLTVILVFLLSLELFRNKSIALFASFFTATAPWNVQFSRMASEANVALFFLCLGILSFLYGLRKNPWFLALSSLSVGFSMYTYLSYRVLSPLIALLLVFLYRKEILKILGKYRAPVVLSALFAAVFFFSVAKDSFSYAGQVRFVGTSIFNVPDAYNYNEKQMFVDAAQGINLTRRFFHDSKFFTSFELVTRGYLTHFSPDFLFFDLDQKHHHAPRIGLIYIWMLLFIPIGTYFLLRLGKSKTAIFVLGWLLLAPVPASVTWDIPHAIRTLPMSIPFSFLAAVGVVKAFWELLRRGRLLFSFVLVVFAGVLMITFVYFLHQYFIHFPNERSDKWQYGRKELVEYLENRKGEYDRIVVSTDLQWPNVFFLYYSKYDPKKYLEAGGSESGYVLSQSNKYDKYEFRKFDYDKERGEKALLVGFPGEFPKDIKPLKVINYPDGQPAIYVVEERAKNSTGI